MLCVLYATAPGQTGTLIYTRRIIVSSSSPGEPPPVKPLPATLRTQHRRHATTVALVSISVWVTVPPLITYRYGEPD